MREFELVRDEDVSGVSGVGTVAEGVVFDDGQVVMQWVNTKSLCIYQNIQIVEDVHGHEGRTHVKFRYPRPYKTYDGVA